MTPRALAIVAALIALNVAGARIANTLGLPFFLDTIGTILAPSILGLPFVLLVAIGSSALSSVVNFPGDIWYVGTQIVIGLLAYLFIRLGWFRTIWGALGAGVVIAIVSAIVSAPVTVIVFGGVTVPGVTAVTGVFLAAGQNLWTSVLSGTLITASIDKVASALVVYFIIRSLPERLLSKRSREN